MQTLEVSLGERSYPIHIGSGLLRDPELIGRHLAGRQVMVVTNPTVAALYRAPLEAALAAPGRRVVFTVLPDGERYKTLASAERVYDALLEAGFDRRCTLVALGGGVIGDLTGFVAATYQRGVAFLQCPTTLLAQVDSSVGGKTAVNHPRGKNMIGAFHQPKAVIADLDTLASLPAVEFSAGLAEVIKYGLIDDPDFFEWLEAELPALLDRRTDALAYAVARACADKARIVAADEREQGARALLNLGHTFGHAIETHMDYQGWLHGQAVGAGMVLAAGYSRHLGWIDDETVARIRRLIAAAGLPTEPPPDMRAADFMRRFVHDKKVLDGRLRLVLLHGIGRAAVHDDFDPADLEAWLRAVLGG
ncbi:MAG: 3-dehydroquinate synthase [Gammaproteobacteria bacterium]|nr:MAG: 3-dehydroquinate synthase [Gammaproteobacteria bacterium]